MTDERAPGGALPPDPDFAPQAPMPPPAPAPGWGAPAASPPPPLAPLVNQAAAPTASYVPPPVPPPAMPQPAVAWAAPAPAGPPPKGSRTLLAGIAGILLLLGGIGGILLGLLIAVVGGTVISSLGGLPGLEGIPELNGADPSAVLGGVVAFFGFIIVAYSVAYLLAGIGVLRNSTWARVLGIIVGIISGLIWLPGVTNPSSITSAGGGQETVITAIVAFAIHAYIVVALLLFWRNKAPTA